MISLSFVVEVGPESFRIMKSALPEEWRVARGFFSFDGSEEERWKDEIQLLYDFLVGRWGDWFVVSNVLARSNMYSESIIWDYLSDFKQMPTPENIRDALMAYARENFTASMLLQEDESAWTP